MNNKIVQILPPFVGLPSILVVGSPLVIRVHTIHVISIYFTALEHARVPQTFVFVRHPVKSLGLALVVSSVTAFLSCQAVAIRFPFCFCIKSPRSFNLAEVAALGKHLLCFLIVLQA